MRKNYFVRSFAALFILFVISLNVFISSANAQEENSANTNQTSTPTPTPAPTPIPVSDIITQAEANSKRLREIQTGLSDNPNISDVERGLPLLTEELNSQEQETNQLLTSQPSLETLRKAEQVWKSFASRFPDWKEGLKTQAAIFNRQINELKNFNALWLQTMESLKISQSSTNANTETSSNSNSEISSNSNSESASNIGTEIPPEISQRIQTTIAAIQQTQKQVEEQRTKLLTLQTRISEQESRVRQTLETVGKVREEALTHLFRKDSPAIWKLQSGTNPANGLVQQTENSFITQAKALNEYAYRQSDRFFLHGILLVLLIGGLFWGRKGVRPKVKEEPKLKQATVVFEYPISTALILTILLSGWLYPQAPRILSSLLGAAALIPGIIILRNLIEKSLFPILNALMIFYFIDRLRDVTASLPVISRTLFLAEMLGAIIFLLWVLRSKRLTDKIPVKHQRIFTTIKKIIPFALGIFTGAFIANALGFVNLARIVGNGILGSAYIALILYTALQIAESLLVFAVRVRPFSSLGMVKTHRRMLLDKILLGLRWLAFAAWIILTLNVLSIREPIFTFFRDILTAQLNLGSFHISLKDIIAFAITVWLAFLISRFVRFVLEEDVYPRVNLAGGIPYAITTMTHYVILVVGFFLALAALEVDLTKFAILAGAFGVGLGFGLQNIVNNFVSGLILLFERPVKVGDVVQIGENQGDLRRIGLRASVVRTLQGADVIVPNGQLISEKVINWTFSDQRRRLDINVGVAYGNDPAEVIKILTEAVSDHPDILKEPAPSCLFLGFGDNSLDFQARAWTGKTSQWVVVQSDLAVAMNKALTDAGIEIPFPQRDLNLKIVDKELLENLRGIQSANGAKTEIEKAKEN
ncbi:MAG: mechanosensitive ion channel domain-containing protein [Acidobacteriota bacterium]